MGLKAQTVGRDACHACFEETKKHQQESNGYASRTLLRKWLVLLAVSRFALNQKGRPYLPGTR